MTDDLTPPPGFSLQPPPGFTLAPPPGFALQSPAQSEPPAPAGSHFDRARAVPDFTEDEINAIQAERLKKFGPDKPDEPAAPFKAEPGEPAAPARNAGLGEVITTAAAQPFHDMAQTYQGLTGGKPAAKEPGITAAEPITLADVKDPALLGKKFVYGLLSSSPEMAGAIMGGAMGAGPAAATGPGAPVVEALSIGAGAALGHAVRAFGPAFGEELKKSPGDPDGAFNRAWMNTGISSAFTGGGFAAFGIAPFASTLKNLMFQGVGIQAPLAAGEQAVSNVREGKPALEGTADAAFAGAAGTMAPMAVHAGVRGLRDTRVDPTLRAGLEAMPGAADQANQRTVAPNAPAGTEPVPGEADLAKFTGTPEPPTPESAPPVAQPPPPPANSAHADMQAVDQQRQAQRAKDQTILDTLYPERPEETPVPPPAEPTSEPPVSGSYVTLSPDQLTVDPARFQFKASDEKGVTGALQGTDRWEPDLASPIMAWQANDGQMFVADGHQRHDLATRATAAGQENVQIPARLYREADGYDPAYMRSLAAYKNISEGSGTAIDAAKVMRDADGIPDNRRLPDLPPRQQMVKDGAALAKLSDDAFGVVVNGVVPPGYAAHVGNLISDPAEQMGALQVLARAQPANSEQARLMVQDVRASGFAKGVQDGLFGEEAFATSLIPERARVLDNAMRNLRGTRRVFKAAVEGEEALTGAGNVLDSEGNARAKTENERLLDSIERNATTHGPVSAALNAAARDLADGRPMAGVVSQFLAKTRGIIRRGQDESVRSGDTAGRDGSPGEGEAGQHVEGQEGFFAKRGDAEWEALLARGAKVKRDATAYAEARKPARFKDRYGLTYLVSKDLNYPPDGWRVTTFNREGEPVGHYETKNAFDAFREVLAGNPEKIGSNHPAAGQLARRPEGERVEPIGDLTPAALVARDRLSRLAAATMRFAGLPESVGLKLAGKITDAAGGAADGHYMRNLVTLALDTAPHEIPTKLWHETIHALADKDLGLLTTAQRRALEVGADRWLERVGNRERLTKLGYAPGEMREEAIARMGEESLARGLAKRNPFMRAYDRITNAVDGLGQALRGGGYHTAEDVFRGVMGGERATPEAREALGQAVSDDGTPAPMTQPEPPDGFQTVKVGDTEATLPDQYFARRAPLPPQTGADLFGEQRAEREKREPEPTIRNDKRQADMFGGQEAVQAQAARDAAGPRSGQKPADEGLFAAKEPEQGGLLSRRDPVEVLREAAPRSLMARQAVKVIDYAGHISEGIKGALTPMATGSKRAQDYAFRFANALRGVTYQFGLIDKGITKQFKPEAREAMGRAMDNESVFEQRLAELSPEERAAQEATLRAAHDATGEGIAGLPADQRAVVEQLAALGQTVWERMRDRGLVAPGAEGLPYYFARQIVMRDEHGEITRVGADGAGGADINEIAKNVSTRGPQRREHLTPEETEAAAKVKLGTGATLIRDIRSVVQKLATNERAIAGTDLLAAVKKVGDAAGVNLVLHGDIPNMLAPADYFTLNHPSFRKFTGTGWQNIHVAREFEGPMRAVLSEKTGDLYNALMKAKGGVMSAIMYSPFMHLGVEIGRALPLMPGKIMTMKFWRDAYTLRNDSGFMAQATKDGLAPIGQGWSLDPVKVAEEARTDNPKSTLGQMAEKWHEVHQRLLWDQVFNLQVGIYNEMRGRFEAKGFAPDVSGVMAAHMANRYAGALPPENLSRLANQTANLVLFSRSFTLGNLGVIKDMFNGAPAHIRASIEQMAGSEVAKNAQTALKRKAVATFALDIGLFYVANAALQSMIAVGQRAPDMGLGGAASSVAQEWWDNASDSMSKVGENPMNAFGVLPQHFNEPGKQDRVYVGNDSEGRGTYLRLPAGKVGEEFLGWFTHPGPLLMNKLSPFVRPLVEAIFGTDSLGRPVYKPDPKTIGDYISNAGMIATHLASSAGPVQQVQGAYNAITGRKGDTGVEAAKAILPTLGIGQISGGYPGGPQAGFEASERRGERYDVAAALPDVRALVKANKIQAAVDLLEKTGARGTEIRGIIRHAANPAAATASLDKWYSLHKDAMNQPNVTGGARATP